MSKVHSFAECLYYLVRADNDGIPEKDEYFDQALIYARDNNNQMNRVELHALVFAAKRRHRLGDLDEAMSERFKKLPDFRIWNGM